MIESDIAASVSTIQKGIDESLKSIKTSASGKRNAEAPLMNALGRALQNNRGIRRYFGDGRQVNGFSTSILVQMETQNSCR